MTSLLFLVIGTSASAQSPNATPDPVLQACEEVADTAKRLEIENASLKVQLDLANQRIVLEKERTTNAFEQRDFFKKAYESSAKIDTNSGLIIENLRTQVADYRSELEEVRTENSRLRSSRNWRTVFGFGAGLGAGYYLGNK